ncbi:nucleotide exchange factor GrpE [candidate division CSSED10-310 bacterium]|uniref:Nucleotide exchange factor GrpE n=1 Tax=candidate division CSSED10-310 bacterium TaxID=2855610 RepID=A0ABV6YZG6_UNCC1
MKNKKEYLKNKFIEFQVKIAELTTTLAQQQEQAANREKELFRTLIEIVDAFDHLDETIAAKEPSFDKTTKSLVKNMRSIQKKLKRLLSGNNIIKIEFPDNKASIQNCKIVETRPGADLENETILLVVKPGYINQVSKQVLRKAEVITVLND